VRAPALGAHGQAREQGDARTAGHHLGEREQAGRPEARLLRLGGRADREGLLAEAVAVVEQEHRAAAQLLEAAVVALEADLGDLTARLLLRRGADPGLRRSGAA